MGQVTVNNNTYKGKLIFSNGHKIYAIDEIRDKFLFLHQKDGEFREFLITGIDKVKTLIDMITQDENNSLRKKIQKDLMRIREECYNKKLNRKDTGRLKTLMSNYYDEHYVLFIYLGIDYKTFMKEEDKNGTSCCWGYAF